MNITQEKTQGVIVCAVDGEITLHNSPELRKAFDGILSGKARTPKVLIDLSRVPYVDSSGLATLIEMAQRLAKAGGRLRLCGMDARIKNMFEITRLNTFFEIFRDRHEALKNF